MKRIICGWVLLLFVTALAGCGSEKDRNVNADRDKPRAAKDNDADK
jgi:hypothetical protein